MWLDSSTLRPMIADCEPQEDQAARSKEDVLNHVFVVLFVGVVIGGLLELCEQWVRFCGSLRILCTIDKLIEILLESFSI